MPSSIVYTTVSCPLGTGLVARTEKGVCAVLLGDSIEAAIDELQRRFPGRPLLDAPADADAERVIVLLQSPADAVNVPVDAAGTAFQQSVWAAIREIPAGSTATYSEIAERIGRHGSARAVAQACAANPLAVLVPCHRVVRSSGELSGYRWGVERKRLLLQREADSTPPGYGKRLVAAEGGI